jgi:hypothetical protein
MSDVSPSIKQHLNTFVKDIQIDEKEDERARLEKHLELINDEIRKAFESIRIEGMEFEKTRAGHGNQNGYFPSSVQMRWFLALGGYALVVTLFLSFILGTGYPGFVNPPAANPVETQVSES